jgi:transketolase
MALQFGPRRGTYLNISDAIDRGGTTLSKDEIQRLEIFDLAYRSLCAILYNYVPTSGHPGGSISSGRFVEGIIFYGLDYDFTNPDRADADILSYAAGHKALGLYAMWALRNEIVRIGNPSLLPKDEKYQLRLEDMLGFRRNPITDTPLFTKFKAKSLDGHPTPATPFVRLSTGASGVGVAASLGLAFGAKDYFGKNSPLVHIVEGEGGMTPGRVSEAFASAGTSSLSNAFIHIDWNQASIDSNHVCRNGSGPGDYVQWTPQEFAYLHDWNVIDVPDGKDFAMVIAAQREALKLQSGQPTAIVYRTIKGWQYGIEGRLSHGAGHKFCSDGYYKALETIFTNPKDKIPSCDPNSPRCKGRPDVNEECFYDALMAIRGFLEANKETCQFLAAKTAEAKTRLDALSRKPRDGAPDVGAIYDVVKGMTDETPAELKLAAGASTTLRGELGKTLQYLNKKSGGAVLCAAADLLGSTSVNESAKGFPEGFFNAKTNPGARVLSIGGICEDAISGILSGISTFGHHVGVGSSYGAFIAPLGHIASRLHAIGNQARQAIKSEPYKPFILICAHAGLKTGEDGPTHADPQALQLLQENFPKGTMITLTPWDPQEISNLLAAALSKRPAIIAPFVTRPNEKVLDRRTLGLAPVTTTNAGVYRLMESKGKSRGTIVLQGSDVAYAFIEKALPLLKKEGVDLNAYYVSSAELFDMLPTSEQKKIFPEEHAMDAMGITGFTLPTMLRWIRSDFGRAMTMHPFQHGHYLGSGQAEQVMAEAGLDGESQFKAILKYIKEKKS